METALTTEEEMLLFLLRSPFATHTVTELSQTMKMSRPGVWKSLKKLERNTLISLTGVGKGKTSTYIIQLHRENPVLHSLLTLGLTKETSAYERFRVNFKELAPHVDFLILYGSILHSPNEAHDIDLIGVVSSKRNFITLHTHLATMQKIHAKKIHAIFFTPAEFTYELKQQNRAFIDAIQKGIVLYGQDNFVSFIQKLM